MTRTYRNENYKGFQINKGKGWGWEILNSNGQRLRVCRTKQECKLRIDWQIV